MHMPTYPDATQWSTVMNVKTNTVDRNAAWDVAGVRPIIKRLTKRIHVFDENVQKQRIAEYKLQKRLKQQEWDKIIANKKALMTLICRQCDKATLTELPLKKYTKLTATMEAL